MVVYHQIQNQQQIYRNHIWQNTSGHDNKAAVIKHASMQMGNFAK